MARERIIEVSQISVCCGKASKRRAKVGNGEGERWDERAVALQGGCWLSSWIKW